MKRLLTAASLMVLLLVNAFFSPTLTRANPTTIITVTTTTDELNTDGDCSLREAITAANTDSTMDICSAGTGGDTIIFAPELSGTISTSSPLPVITDTLSIVGPGSEILEIHSSGNILSFNGPGEIFSLSGLYLNGSGGATIGINLSAGTLTVLSTRISGNTNGGVFIFFSGIATIISSTISNNSAPGGGGIVNYGSLILIDSTVSNNGASFGGGGIYNTGVATITASLISDNMGGGFGALGGGGVNNTGLLWLVNSTVSGNSAPSNPNNNGGGLHNSGVMTITNSAIISNTTAGTGGGMEVVSGTVTVQNTIVANSIVGGDCSQSGGTIINDGFNLIEDNSCGFTGGSDPLLGPLQDNGGPTLTHALLIGSPAIDAGNPAGCTDSLGNPLTTDQRGFLRPVDGDGNATAICDIGAYEYGSFAPADLSVTQTDSPDPLLFGNAVTYIITVANAGPGDATGVVLTDTLPVSATLGLVTPSQGSCNGTSEVVCNLGTIVSNGSVTVTLVVTPTTTGLHNNLVTMAGNEVDPTSPNSDTETTLVADTIYSLYLPLIRR